MRLVGRVEASSVRTGKGRVKRTKRKAPLRDLGRRVIRSAGVRSGERRLRRFSERRSVKSSVGPMGIVRRAFLIQKMNMRGRAAKPTNIQPMEYLRKRKVMPPNIKKVAVAMRRARTMGRLNECFCFAAWTRELCGSKRL